MGSFAQFHSSTQECLRMGVRLLTYTEWEIDRVCERTNLERFSAHYGFLPATIAAVLYDNQDIQHTHLFMTLSWWKLYDSEHAMESQWKVHPETFEAFVIRCVQSLQLGKKKNCVFWF